MTEEQIRERIRQMIDADASGGVDFVERLKIVRHDTLEVNGVVETFVVASFYLIQDSDAS